MSERVKLRMYESRVSDLEISRLVVLADVKERPPGQSIPSCSTCHRRIRQLTAHSPSNTHPLRCNDPGSSRPVPCHSNKQSDESSPTDRINAKRPTIANNTIGDAVEVQRCRAIIMTKSVPHR